MSGLCTLCVCARAQRKLPCSAVWCEKEAAVQCSAGQGRAGLCSAVQCARVGGGGGEGEAMADGSGGIVDEHACGPEHRPLLNSLVKLRVHKRVVVGSNRSFCDFLLMVSLLLLF